MKYKVGQIFYSAVTDIDYSFDKPKATQDIFEYQVRTIRGGKVYAILKIKGYNWGKLSKKHFDYGWINKNIEPWMRKSWKIDSEPSGGLRTTKLAAWKCALSDLHKRKRMRKKYPEIIEELELEIAIAKKRVKAFGKK